jgi:glycosyltransferase involved in cell wall biosynthesis
MQDPTVSVVIPAYNSARYISQALDSVKAQTFSEYEVIVVNDGSQDRDELERIIHSHPLPIVYLSQENKGVSAARNAAIRIAKGEFYAQLDADDQWMPDYLDVQLKTLADNPDVALVYPNATIIGDEVEAEVEFMKLSPSEGEVCFETLVTQQCVVMTCVTARMSAIRDAGLFDEELRSCEDFDLWLRVAKKVGRIVYHRRVLALYRRHMGSLSSDRVCMLLNLLAVFEKCGRTLELSEAETKILNREIIRNRSMLHLLEGKRSLAAGRASNALADFRKANEHMRSPKLMLVTFLLRYTPQSFIWAFKTRERFLMKQPDNQLTGIDQPPSSTPAVGGIE